MAIQANPRAAAVEILLRVTVRGEMLTTAMPAAARDLRERRDAGLAKEIAFGVLRWLPRLEAVLALLLERRIRERDRDLHLLLLVGLYQLIYMSVPAYAAVAETVATADMQGKPWAKGLLNGVLRRFIREQDRVLAAADQEEQAAFAHPSWLVAAIRDRWPQDWHQILTANNERPPMTLRVNRQRISPEPYLTMLGGAGLSASRAPHTDTGLILVNAVDVNGLPGFSDGLVSVQDAAAQQAAGLLELQPGQRVLDACAAPGGKTAHILECQPMLAEVVAVDKDPGRLELVSQTLDRLGLRATVSCADAGHPANWWDGNPFDRILLDAPCSATGVIRRHPDIKLHRQPGHLQTLVHRQNRLLDALWRLLARGGTLVYATCSIFHEENENQVARFVEAHPDAQALPVEVPWGRDQRFGRQTLPGEDSMDGFFYALIKKD